MTCSVFLKRGNEDWDEREERMGGEEKKGVII
jgi:hypothetical protein